MISLGVSSDSPSDEWRVIWLIDISDGWPSFQDAILSSLPTSEHQESLTTANQIKESPHMLMSAAGAEHDR